MSSAFAEALEEGLNPAWKKGPGISRENLIKGTGPVEHISHEEAMMTTRSSGKPKKESGPNALMGFGKYSGRTIGWVEENDPRYFDWVCENVKGFEDRVK